MAINIMSNIKIGRWTVLDDSTITASGERKWLCRCDCGTERYVLERTLKYGGSQSCGCLRKERAAESVTNDLTGKTFGELTVLHQAEHQRKKAVCGGPAGVPAEIHTMFRGHYWSLDAEHIVLKRCMNGTIPLSILQGKSSTDLLHCMLRKIEMKKVP